MKHLGNLTVTAQNAHSFPAVNEIYGHLTIAAGTSLIAPRLTLVHGWLTVEAGGSLTAPVLGLVDGWVTLNGELHALHLTEIRQDFTIGGDAIIDLPALTTVGALNLQRGATKMMPALTEVARNLTLMPMAGLRAPLLEKINGSLTVRENANLDVPQWHHIGAYVDIDETAVVIAPNYGRGA